METGDYITYYNTVKKIECSRLGRKSKCFCGHLLEDHNNIYYGKKFNTKCQNCKCTLFMNIPQRPEECGMWWLPRRKDFNVHKWRPPCRCKHTCEEHHPYPSFKCKLCSCYGFDSNFACISCDGKWEDHEVLYETLMERQKLGKKVNKEYLPLGDTKLIQHEVFKDKKMIKQEIQEYKDNGVIVKPNKPKPNGYMPQPQFQIEDFNNVKSKDLKPVVKAATEEEKLEKQFEHMSMWPEVSHDIRPKQPKPFLKKGTGTGQKNQIQQKVIKKQ